jgi:hypothetical protein
MRLGLGSSCHPLLRTQSLRSTPPTVRKANFIADGCIDSLTPAGTFFVDMTATGTTSTSVPTISGTTNLSTTPLPGSVGALVLLHAICLGGSFVILFPLGVSLLRFFNSVRLHWMLQIIATGICFIGLAVAVALSVMDVEYNSFTAVHQIVGILVVIVLVLQLVLGYVHHTNFKRAGGRTWASNAHIWIGRTMIVVGMVNTVLYAICPSLISSDYHSPSYTREAYLMLCLPHSQGLPPCQINRRCHRCGDHRHHHRSGYLRDKPFRQKAEKREGDRSRLASIFGHCTDQHQSLVTWRRSL